MLHIGQPIKLNSGELAIYLGVDIHANNPNGETVILTYNGELKRIDSFDSPVTNKDRKWTYYNLEDKDGKPVYRIFCSGLLGFFGYCGGFPDDELGNQLKKEMLDYLEELESAN